MMTPSLGPGWLDPSWLLTRFGQQLVAVAALMVFVECGLLFPFLPGDSLLFAVGLFVRRAQLGQPGLDLPLPLACVLLSAAAFAGNVSGYEIGRRLGPSLRERPRRLVRVEHLDSTQEFFERHGQAALVLGRFVPVVRTFVTVVAGVGRMPRHVFYTWSLVGAVLWVTALVVAGYLLGGIPWLQRNLDALVLVVVAVSLVPAAVHWWRARRRTAPVRSTP